jgi:preprotein translocase subunit SecG
MDSVWHTTSLVFHMIAAIGIVILVLLQHGKGADMGAAFGSGSAGSLFGSAGASNFMSKTTAVLAAVFFVTSLALTYFSAPSRSGGVTQHLEAPAAVVPGEVKSNAKPAAPASSAPAPAGSPTEKSSEIPK